MPEHRLSTVEISTSETHDGLYTLDLMTSDSTFISIELSPEDVGELRDKLNRL